MQTFKVNELISLKLEGDRTILYVSNKAFRICKRLLLHIPVELTHEYDEIDSIDEAAEVFGKTVMDGKFYQGLHDPTLIQIDGKISPEEEFWGHCSNIQVWVENDYDTRILHSNLAFPLLRRLAYLGDPKAKFAIKEEIAKRISANSVSVTIYLIENNYLGFLNDDEFDIIFHEINFKEILIQNELLLYLILSGRIDTPRKCKELIRTFIANWMKNGEWDVLLKLFQGYNFFKNFGKQELNSLIEAADFSNLVNYEIGTFLPLLKFLARKKATAKHVLNDILLKRADKWGWEELPMLINQGIFNFFTKPEVNLLLENLEFEELLKQDYTYSLPLLKELSKYGTKTFLNQAVQKVVENLTKEKLYYLVEGKYIDRKDLASILEDLDFQRFISRDYKEILTYLYSLSKIGGNAAKNCFKEEVKKLLLLNDEDIIQYLIKEYRYWRLIPAKESNSIIKQMDLTYHLNKEVIKGYSLVNGLAKQSYDTRLFLQDFIRSLIKETKWKVLVDLYEENYKLFNYFPKEELKSLFEEIDISKLGTFTRERDFSLLQTFAFYNEKARKILSQQIIKAIERGETQLIDYIFKRSYFKWNISEEDQNTLSTSRVFKDYLKKKLTKYISLQLEGEYDRNFKNISPILKENGFHDVFDGIVYEKLPPSILQDLINLGDQKASSYLTQKKQPDFLKIFEEVKNIDRNHLIKILLSEQKFISINFDELPSKFHELDLDLIKDLDLSDGKLNDYHTNSKFKLPETLGLFTGLERLTLRGNWITALPNSIGALNNLQHLDLSENRLNGVLPNSLGNLKSLKFINLSQNHSLLDFPETMNNLDSIDTLILSGDSWSSSIPKSIGFIIGLKKLIIEKSMKPSSLPETIGNIVSLEELHMPNNKLTSIPESITKLKNLEYIDFSYNQLNELPDLIGNLTNLKVLLLKKNNIKNLPDSIINLKKIEQIDLSLNPLKTIPKKLLDRALKNEITLKFNYRCKKCRKKHSSGKLWLEHLDKSDIEFI